MRLATLPWDKLERDLGRALRLPKERRASADAWRAISPPLATFIASAAAWAFEETEEDDGAIIDLLADLGIDLTRFLARLRAMLPAAQLGPDMAKGLLARGTLDAAAAAGTWTWDGIIGVDIRPLGSEALRSIRVQGQQLLRWIGPLAEPATLPEVLARLDDRHAGGLILRWTTQTFALVPGYCTRRNLPTLGRPPAAYAMAKRAAMARPLAQPQGATGAAHAALVQDITAVVSEVAHQPARIRQDWTWRIADAKRILARLPDGLEHGGATAHVRLAMAVDACRLLSLTRSVAKETHAGEDGLAWLRGSTGERQHQLLARLRPLLRAESAAGRHDDYVAAYLLSRAIGEMLSSHAYVKLWSLLATSWCELGDATWLRSEALAWWQRSPPQGPDHVPEATWGRLVTAGLDCMAVPLGIVAAAGTTESRTITLTPAGRWALGLEEAWTPPAEARLTAPIIVQPDHTIIFLAPDSAIEVDIGMFADRLPGAQGTGALFTLSKTACRRAAIAGLDAAHAVNVLSQASAKPLPANVVRELNGWFGRLRRAHARPSLVITTTDEETADALVAILGAVRLGPHAVSLPLTNRPAELERRLAKEGILLDTSAIPR